MQTKAIKHDFAIEYTDQLGMYMDTLYETKLNVHPIATQIIIDTIYSSPNINKTIKCDVQSTYGPVTTGNITAYYNDKRIDVSGGDISSEYPEIVLNIEKLSSTKEHIITFKYHDDNKNYADAEQEVILIISKPTVNINMSPTEYYSQQPFNLVATFTDEENKIIDEGEATLYIDGIKKDSAIIINGEATFNLVNGLPVVRTYEMTVVYEDNDYYKRTAEIYHFKVGQIAIGDDNITLETLHSIPNTILTTKVIFNTPNDVDIVDGFVDFFFDEKKINTYAMTEGKDTKYVDLNIPDTYYTTSDKKPHILRLEYYNSSIFAPATSSQEFIIDMQEIVLNVPAFISTNLTKLATAF